MSIARHHAEWLSLIEVSGPFVTMPILMQIFPQGLDAPAPEISRIVRMAYEEWLDNQQGLRPEAAIHTQWLRFVLGSVLEFPVEVLAEGPAMPNGLSYTSAEHGETIRPTLAIVSPDDRKPRLLVQLYPVEQDLDKAIPGRTWKDSPASRMALMLRSANVRLGLVTNGERWMLVDAPRDETTGFASWYAALWSEEKLTLQAFRSLLGSYRFFGVPENQTLEAMLKDSASQQQEVTDQLGWQVRRAVEMLVQFLDKIDKDQNRELLAGLPETELYEAALTVMMRLVFLLSAEERDLLLLGDPLYDQYYAVSTLRVQLREQADQQTEEVLERRHDAWSRLLAIFRVVYGGVEYPDMRLPAYGGHLFDPDRYPFLEGRRPGTSWRDTPAAPLRINNRVVLHLLDALQVLQVRVPGGGPAEARRLSFRALDIEQIGHVYEGLLDHTARRAAVPVLGLMGAKGKEPEVELTRLEAAAAKSENALLDFLEEETGVSRNTLKKNLGLPLDLFQKQRLQVACDNDPALFERVRPYAGLLRLDTFDLPVVITPGSVYVTSGTDRRTTGTHYTPRSLTEPIVQHTLDPLVYFGPAEGKPEAEWQLHSAAEILNLKVCDMAMGSGAFLVQACRYLSGKLQEAWEIAAKKYETQMNPDGTQMNPDGFIVEAEEAKGPTWEWESPISEENGNTDEQAPKGFPVGGEPQINTDKNNKNSSASSGYLLGASAVKNFLQITPEGLPSKGEPGETLIPLDPDEREKLALRLVAERCLYGVDKNQMAVEMAKLSLWLITLDKGRPFTFLDHALRSGDSLLGVNLRQLKAWDMDEEAGNGRGTQLSFMSNLLDRTLHIALELRHRIAAIESKGVRETEHKAALLKEAEEALEVARLGADLLVATALASPARQGVLKDTIHLEYQVMVSAYEQAATATLKRQSTEVNRQSNREAFEALRHRVDELLQDPRYPNQLDKARAPFHWPLEFPEVFMTSGAEEPGFAAIIGNPPFQGGQMITGILGTDYRDYLVESLAKRKKGSADLCAYFFLRMGSVVRKNGNCGLLATKTIAQGDTREVGLSQLIGTGWTISRAISVREWPGAAGVLIAQVWLRCGSWLGLVFLNETPVEAITSYLTPPNATEGDSYILLANSSKSFIGSYVLGLGFVLQIEQAETLIKKDLRNREIIFPFLNGDDLNSRHDQSPSRRVINFHDWSLEKAATYIDCMQIIRDKVKPERDLNNRKVRRERWWQFAERAPELYRTLAQMERTLVVVIHTKYAMFVWQPTNIVFSHALAVITTDRSEDFTVLQSTFHEDWARVRGSSLGLTLRYTPSDCFATFPFPLGIQGLSGIGDEYYNQRQSITRGNKEGLTATYNRFHDQKEMNADIVRLRELHREMDIAVAAAYGWRDLDLAHDFYDTKQGLRYTISENARREVLGRLLKLNHERHAEEVAAGLHDKGKKKGSSPQRVNRPSRDTESNKAGPVAGTKVTQSSVHPTPNGGTPPPSTQPRLFDVEPAGSLWENRNTDEHGEPQINTENINSKENSVSLRGTPRPPVSSPSGIQAGSVVVIQEEGTTDEEEYVLVREADAAKGMKDGKIALAITSPTGAALLGKRPGDKVAVHITPNRKPLIFMVVRVS